MSTGIDYETSEGDMTIEHGGMRRIDSNFGVVCKCGANDEETTVLKRTARKHFVKSGWRFIDGEWRCRKCAIEMKGL